MPLVAGLWAQVVLNDRAAARNMMACAREAAWLFERSRRWSLPSSSPGKRMVAACSHAANTLKLPPVFSLGLCWDLSRHLDGADCTTEAIELAAEFYEHLAETL